MNSAVCNDTVLKCVQCSTAVRTEYNTVVTDTHRYYRYVLTHGDGDDNNMWNVKRRVIPVTIGATGTISRSFRKHVSNIPGHHAVKELQKTAILGTAHILQKVLT